MAENKTRPTGEEVEQFLNGIEDEAKRQDSLTLAELMRQATGMEPRIWASSMVGFGERHYRYESGREGDTFLVGFAPRKQNLALYGLSAGSDEELLARLGKYKTGKGCLYINRLKDVDPAALGELIQRALQHSDTNPAQP